MQPRVGGIITVTGFSNLVSDLLNLVMQIKSVTMWQLSESHWRVRVYQLTDVWQGAVTVCSCHCHYGITLPGVPVLSVVGEKIGRTNSNMFVSLFASVETHREEQRYELKQELHYQHSCHLSLKMPIMFMRKRRLC